jgi:hypothetical protein
MFTTTSECIDENAGCALPVIPSYGGSLLIETSGVETPLVGRILYVHDLKSQCQHNARVSGFVPRITDPPTWGELPAITSAWLNHPHILNNFLP